jgi:hypothetical protein
VNQKIPVQFLQPGANPTGNFGPANQTRFYHEIPRAVKNNARPGRFGEHVAFAGDYTSHAQWRKLEARNPKQTAKFKKTMLKTVQTLVALTF